MNMKEIIEEAEVDSGFVHPLDKWDGKASYQPGGASLLEKALDAIEADEDTEGEGKSLTYVDLMTDTGRLQTAKGSPPSQQPSKITELEYTASVYILLLGPSPANEFSGEEPDAHTLKYEQLMAECLEGKAVLAQEQYYDLPGRESIKVFLKILRPKGEI